MKYSVVLPKIVKYITDIDPRVVWCHENIRSRSWKAEGWHTVRFSFTKESDAVQFALIWSGRES